MEAGARTPEELETLLEDAFVMRDRAELCALFGDGAVLAPHGAAEARGGDAIGCAAAALWAAGGTYVGGTQRVLQVLDTALVVSSAGVHVARRIGDGTWRLAISLLHPTGTSDEEDT
jgi:ketosteroid isomerase-like protein